jgi:hypothetical protein
MSYAMSAALQSAIFSALASDSMLTDLVGDGIYDAVPTGVLPETYVSLGREKVRDASDQSGNGALHNLEISVFTSLPGFSGAKKVAAAVSDILHGADLTLARGRLVFLRFERAEARRINSNSTREILLRFRARVDDA